MENEKEECNISLGLAMGNTETIYSNISHDVWKKQSPVQYHIRFPPQPNEKEDDDEEEQQQRQRQRKRSRDVFDREQEEDSSVKENGGSKKLRLSHEQASVLEGAFRLNNHLNSKHELAEKLKLRPRQVEVWFQNRRARNKMKQTEVDFQLLKIRCETVNEENQILKKELQELKLMKPGLCLSCDGDQWQEEF